VAEFIVSAKLVADASGLKSAVGEAKGAITDLNKAAGSAGQQASTAPVDKLAKAFHEVRAAAAAQSAELAKSAGAQQQAETASSSLGDTLKDTASGLADSGVEALNLGDKLSKVGASAGKFGAILGPVAGALGGVLGLAISGAITGLVSLGASLFESGEEAEDAGKAFDIQKLSARELTKAIDDLDAATKRQTQTSQQGEEQALATAAGFVIEARRRREAAKSALEQAKADLELAAAMAGGGDAGLSIVTQKMGEIRRIEVEITKLSEATKVAEKAYARSALPILQREVAEATSKTAKITGDYERTLGRLNEQLTVHTINTATYRKELEKATKARDAALDVARKEEQQAKRKSKVGPEMATFLNPVDGRISSGFGARAAPKAGASTFHRGLDFAVPSGTSVRAPAVGTVEAVGFDAKLGKYVVIDHGAGTKTKFGHLSDTSAVRVGTQLAAGDAFARSGNTGNSTGAHLHYSVISGGKYVDPAKGRFKVNAGDAALDSESDVNRESKRLADEAKRAADEARRAIEELERSLGLVVGAFDPARAAAEKYADQLDRIAELNRKGFLSDGQAISLGLEASRQQIEAQKKADAALIDRVTGGDFAKSYEDTMSEAAERVGRDAGDRLEEASRRGAREFEREGIEAARAISAALGGKVGNILGDIMGTLVGLQSGNFGGVGGKFGAMLDMLSGGGDPNSAMAKSFGKAIDHLKDVMNRGLVKLGTSVQGISQALPYAAATMAITSSLSSALGIKNRAGGMFGIGGNLLINAAIPSRRGSATITNAFDDPSVRGNSSKYKDAALGGAQGVQASLLQISEALGGSLGSFAVSVGMRDGKYRVDPSGKGITKTKKGALDFGKDEAAAYAAALGDAIKDGAIVGLSAAVQRAIGSSPNIDKALREALKVQEVEDLLSDLGGTMGRQFKDFERQAQERLRIAREYGFDVVALEKRTAEDRAKLVEDVLGARVGSLKALLSDISFGDLFEGSLTDQRTKLLGEISTARADAEAGVDGAADKLADLSRRLIELSRSAFGTAGGEFASDRQTAITGAERVIQLESERVRLAQEGQAQTNEHLNENNNQNAEMITVLRGMDGKLAALIGAASSAAGAAGARTYYEANLALD